MLADAAGRVESGCRGGARGGVGRAGARGKYAFQLAQAFNNFYHEYPVLEENREKNVPAVDDGLFPRATGADAQVLGSKFRSTCNRPLVTRHFCVGVQSIIMSSAVFKVVHAPSRNRDNEPTSPAGLSIRFHSYIFTRLSRRPKLVRAAATLSTNPGASCWKHWGPEVAHALVRAVSALVPTPLVFCIPGNVDTSVDAARTSACATSPLPGKYCSSSHKTMIGCAQNSVIAVSSASYQTPVAPASLVTVFGLNLAPQTAQAQLDQNGQLPTELGGITVGVGGQSAQLLYVSPTQINLVMPAAVAAGTAEIVVQPTGMGQTSRTNIEVRNTAPALFSADATGSGAGAILNGVTFQGGPFLVETQANLGDDKRTRLAIFGTGIRYAGNPFLDPSLTNVAASVVARASDTSGTMYSLPVEYAGAAPTFFGLDQVNVVLPPQLDGVTPLSLTITAGSASSNVVTVAMNSLSSDALRLVGVSLAQSSVLAGSTFGHSRTKCTSQARRLFRFPDEFQPFVQTPSSVTVPAGQVSTDFTLQTNTLGTGSATLTASANGVARTALLIVNSASGPSLSTFTVTPASVSGGTAVTGRITLSGSAAAGGAVVQIAADVTAAQPPSTVTVPFGQSSTTFNIPTSSVGDTTTVNLTATFAGSSQIAALKVNPLFSLTLASPSVVGGQTTTATITLGSPAPIQGAIVNLASNDIVGARVTPFVTIASGQTTATVTITTTASSLSRTVTITATYASVSIPVTLAVVPVGTATSRAYC